VNGRLLLLLARLDRAGRLVENLALVVLLGGMVVASVGQIILREIFETGIIWADEFVRLLVLWLAMVGTIAATRDNRHIRIDALAHLLPAYGVSLTRIVVDLFAAVVCAVVAWQSWLYLKIEMEFVETVLVDVLAWQAHVIVPLAFALTSWRFLVLAVKTLVELLLGEAPWASA